MLITRPNGQILAIAREREARDLVDEPGILLHSFLGDVVPDRDRLVRSTRGKGVVAGCVRVSLLLALMCSLRAYMG